jgi:hypothetical protein
MSKELIIDGQTAGTIVLCKRGLVPVESVVVGDEVLTHMNRWQPVLSVVQYAQQQTVCLRGQGHYGLELSQGHRIYTKNSYVQKVRVEGASQRIPNRIVLIPANKIVETTARKYWATPHSIPMTAFMPPPAEMCEAFFYFLGRWVACGSFSKGDVVVSCGFHDADSTEAWLRDGRLRNSNGQEFNIRTRDLPDTRQLIIGSSHLQRWIESEFGRRSRNKVIPTWLLGLQRNWREMFLQGYVDGDGSVTDAGRAETTTTSKTLAIGVRLLSTGLGNAVSLSQGYNQPTVIDGREIPGGYCYKVYWKQGREVDQCYADERHQFLAVKELIGVSVKTVYSLQVQDDRSLVADGIVVNVRNATDRMSQMA